MRSDFDEFAAAKLAEGASLTRVSIQLRALREFWHFLTKVEELPLINPVPAINLGGTPKPKPTLTEDVLKNIIANLKKQTEVMAFYLVVGCGVRPSDLSKLRWKHVDLHRGLIGLMTSTKYGSTHIAYIPSRLLPLFEAQKSRPEDRVCKEVPYKFLKEQGTTLSELFQTHVYLVGLFDKNDVLGALERLGEKLPVHERWLLRKEQVQSPQQQLEKRLSLDPSQMAPGLLPQPEYTDL